MSRTLVKAMVVYLGVISMFRKRFNVASALKEIKTYNILTIQMLRNEVRDWLYRN